MIITKPTNSAILGFSNKIKNNTPARAASKQFVAVAATALVAKLAKKKS